MTCSARPSLRASAWRAAGVVALALLVADCARQAPPPATAQSTAKPQGAAGPQSAAARPTPGAPGSAPAGAATLVPPDLALAFLQELKSAATPPCRFTDKGTWSGGEYRKITGQRAATQIANYSSWSITKIEDANGREFLPADLERAGAWSYTLRTPRSARTPFGIADQCLLGPTGEPARKVVEALSALGVSVPPELAYIVR